MVGVTAPFGVPLITQVVLFIESPPGNEGEIEQLEIEEPFSERVGFTVIKVPMTPLFVPAG
jgi:hypothetical protein